jgi:hypothetical protein
MKIAFGIFTFAGAALSLWLVGILLFASPFDSFSEQGGMLMDMVWGQISMLDLYSGFFLGIALVWLLEPKLWVKILVTLTLPFIGNPILAVWLIIRASYLLKLNSVARAE